MEAICTRIKEKVTVTRFNANCNYIIQPKRMGELGFLNFSYFKQRFFPFNFLGINLLTLE